MTCRRAGPGALLSHWFHFAAYRGMVVAALRADVSAVTCSPVAAGRRVEFFTNNSIVVWDSGRAR